MLRLLVSTSKPKPKLNMNNVTSVDFESLSRRNAVLTYWGFSELCTMKKLSPDFSVLADGVNNRSAETHWYNLSSLTNVSVRDLKEMADIIVPKQEPRWVKDYLSKH